LQFREEDGDGHVLPKLLRLQKTVEEEEGITDEPYPRAARRTTASGEGELEVLPAIFSQTETSIVSSDFGEAERRANRTEKRGKRGAISPGSR
jgi:hypothetical protein